MCPPPVQVQRRPSGAAAAKRPLPSARRSSVVRAHQRQEAQGGEWADIFTPADYAFLRALATRPTLSEQLSDWQQSWDTDVSVGYQEPNSVADWHQAAWDQYGAALGSALASADGGDD